MPCHGPGEPTSSPSLWNPSHSVHLKVLPTLLYTLERHSLSACCSLVCVPVNDALVLANLMVDLCARASGMPAPRMRLTHQSNCTDQRLLLSLTAWMGLLRQSEQLRGRCSQLAPVWCCH